MNIIIDIVRFHIRHDHIDADILYSFYRGQLLRYENVYLDLMHNDKYQEQILQLEIIYKDNLLLVEREYQSQGTLNISNVLTAFEAIAKIVCFSMHRDIHPLSLIIDDSIICIH
jgi:hypothetical protein